MDDENPIMGSMLVDENGTIESINRDKNPTDFDNTGIEKVNLEGKTIMPGFIDAHIHLLEGGSVRRSLNITHCENINDIKDAVNNYVNNMKPGQEWIIAYGYRDRMFGTLKKQNRYTLDTIINDLPLIIVKGDGHSAIVNSKAIEKYPLEKLVGSQGINERLINRDSNGQLTGVLLENSFIGIIDYIKENEKVDPEEIITETINYLTSYGITCVNDNTFYRYIYEIYEKLKNENRLNIRIASWLFAYDDNLRKELEDNINLEDRRLKLNGAKYFMDGSINSRTAYVREPYLDSKDASYGKEGRGLLNLDTDRLIELMEIDRKQGLQSIVHCIGDGAIETYLDILSNNFNSQDYKLMRPRIEHCTILSPDLMQKLIETKPVVTYQQGELTEEVLKLYEKIIGKERMKHLDETNFLLENKVPVSFSSDWPYINPPEPFNMLEKYRHQNKKLSLYDMLNIYTRGNAYADKSENYLGRLKTGYVADFIVINDNPLSDTFVNDGRPLTDIDIGQTYVNGDKIYEKQ